MQGTVTATAGGEDLELDNVVLAAIWSSQDALTGNQWRWTGNGRPRLMSQAGKRLHAWSRCPG